MKDELPENVDLQWIGRHIVDSRNEMREFRDEMRGSLRAIGRELQSLRDDVNVTAAILRRMDHNLESHTGEIRALYELIADLRARVEALEGRRQ
jgi:chromosome segregation ATPase